LNIYRRFKLYTGLIVITGSLCVIRGVYNFLNLPNWAASGYLTENAMKITAFWLIFAGILFTGYFVWYLRIPEIKDDDTESLYFLRKKENHFLLGIALSIIVCLISAYLIY
jgi:hypothetical protein